MPHGCAAARHVRQRSPIRSPFHRRREDAIDALLPDPVVECIDAALYPTKSVVLEGSLREQANIPAMPNRGAAGDNSLDDGHVVSLNEFGL